MFVGEPKHLNKPVINSGNCSQRGNSGHHLKELQFAHSFSSSAQLCDENLSALLGMIRLKSRITLSHFASCTARQVYATRKGKCFNSKVLCSSPKTTTTRVMHTSSIAIRSLLSPIVPPRLAAVACYPAIMRTRVTLIRRSCPHSAIRASTEI